VAELMSGGNGAHASDAFIRHVGHDLRSSLNAVVAWGELVRSGQLPPEELTRAGDTIVRQVRQLSRRLSDVLDLWRLDVGALTLSPTSGPVSSAVRSAVDGSRLHFETRHVECRMTVEADGAAVLDTLRLTQALTLLLMDAAVNTAAGDAVDVRVAAREGGGLMVTITGGGKAPNACAFDRDRADTMGDGTRPFDFGLSLAQTLCALNHATLTVERGDADRVVFVVGIEAVPTAPAAAAQPRASATSLS
jgi:signal transduction histidine kinase